MERKTFSVVFFCKKTKITSKGKAPILARIIVNGQMTHFSTKFHILPDWKNRLKQTPFDRRKLTIVAEPN